MKGNFMKHLALILVLLSFISLITSCSIISDALEKNPPLIKAFEATPTEALTSEDILFSWEVADIDGDQLICTLDFGDDETEKVENCLQITNTFHTFEKPGTYIVKLSVSDGGETTVKTVPVVLKESQVPDEPGEPSDKLVIEQFIAQPETGEAPLLSVFRWTVSAKDAVTCTLDFGDDASETIENCQDVTDTFHEFKDPGGYRVVLSADNGKNKVRKSLIIVVNAPPAE